MSNEALGWVFKHSPYEGTKRVIHLAIADVVNDAYDNKFWMSNENLAAKARCSRAYVNNTLSEMVKSGYLEVVQGNTGRSKTVEYRFIFHDPESVKTVDTLESVNTVDTLGAESVNTVDTLSPESVNTVDTIPIDINPSKEEPKDMSVSEKIAKVWDSYTQVCERCQLGKKRFTPERRELIRRRLNEWSVEELVKAIEGLEFSDFHRGKNERRKAYDSIELILRDAKHIEQFTRYNETIVDPKKRVNDAWGRERPQTNRGKVIVLE